MSYEPYSLTTRKTRTSLVLVSFISIFAWLFDIRLGDIPYLDITGENRDALLHLALGSLSVYFLIYFTVYSSDDIDYSSPPPGLLNKRDRSLRFWEMTDGVRAELRSALGEERFDAWFERGEGDFWEAIGRGESVPKAVLSEKYVDVEQLRDAVLLYTKRNEQEPEFDENIREMFLAFAYFYQTARLGISSLEVRHGTQVRVHFLDRRVPQLLGLVATLLNWWNVFGTWQ